MLLQYSDDEDSDAADEVPVPVPVPRHVFEPIHQSGRLPDGRAPSADLLDPSGMLQQDSTALAGRDEESYTVHTSSLFDSKQRIFLPNITLVVSRKTSLITSITTRRSLSIPGVDELSLLADGLASPIIDLRGKHVLPGLIDSHAHIFLHPYANRSATVQERDESPVERTLRGSNHARSALLAGFTTYRDLGSEGLLSMDVNFRDAINRGIIPGPRMFVVSEALGSSGGYEVRLENGKGSGGRTRVGRIANEVDGIWGVRAGVRRRIGAGADVIKFYADYRRRELQWPKPLQAGPSGLVEDVLHPPALGERSPASPLFTLEEMKAIVEEAEIAGCPTAAHASDIVAAKMAVKSGVTTLEHCTNLDEDTIELMKDKGTIFCPTLAIMKTSFGESEAWEAIKANAFKAWKAGVKIAAGGDTGPYPHGENARDMICLLEAGIPMEDVLQAATLHGYAACGGPRTGDRFGYLAEGWKADLVALDGDPMKDWGALWKVGFVMKDGKVWKADGKAVGMV